MKGVPFSNKRYTKGVPFLKKWYLKGKGLDLGAEPPRIELQFHVKYPPGGGYFTWNINNLDDSENGGGCLGSFNI